MRSGPTSRWVFSNAEPVPPRSGSHSQENPAAEQAGLWAPNFGRHCGVTEDLSSWNACLAGGYGSFVPTLFVTFFAHDRIKD